MIMTCISSKYIKSNYLNVAGILKDGKKNWNMKNNNKVARSYSESQKQRIEDLKTLELAKMQEKELNKKVKYLTKRFVL